MSKFRLAHLGLALAALGFTAATPVIGLAPAHAAEAVRAEIASAEARRAQEAANAYIQQVAGSSPSEEIAKAKALLDAGTITPDEYSLIKAKALQ